MAQKEKKDLIGWLNLGEEYKSGNKKQVGDVLNLVFNYIRNSNNELVLDSELNEKFISKKPKIITKRKPKITSETLEEALRILEEKKIIYECAGSNSSVRTYKKDPAAKEYLKQNL